MTKKNKCKTYTSRQLALFAKEIKKAGGFDELMIEKKAVEPKNGAYAILVYENVKEYKTKYLIGDYKSLRPCFNTKVPYSFWSQLYMALKRKMILEK